MSELKATAYLGGAPIPADVARALWPTVPPKTVDAVLADLEAVAGNFDMGWRAEPPTMAALVRRVIRDVRAAIDAEHPKQSG